MATTSGSTPIEPGDAGSTGSRRPAPPTSQDPEVLAEQIEQTREDLAETLDAIADRVSPKRVADRTRKKVADAVKDGTETVKAKSGVVRERVTEQAGTVRGKVQEQVETVKDKVASSGGHGAHEASSVAVTGAAYGEPGTTGTTGTGDLPSTAPVAVPPLDLSTPATSTGGTSSSSAGPVGAFSASAPPATAPSGSPAYSPYTSPASSVKKEYVGGGLAALVLLLLLRRRRRTKRTRRGLRVT